MAFIAVKTYQSHQRMRMAYFSQKEMHSVKLHHVLLYYEEQTKNCFHHWKGSFPLCKI